MEKKCSTCKYWKNIQADMGECRFRSAIWERDCYHWCGEWTPKGHLSRAEQSIVIQGRIADALERIAEAEEKPVFSGELCSTDEPTTPPFAEAPIRNVDEIAGTALAEIGDIVGGHTPETILAAVKQCAIDRARASTSARPGEKCVGLKWCLTCGRELNSGFCPECDK